MLGLPLTRPHADVGRVHAARPPGRSARSSSKRRRRVLRGEPAGRVTFRLTLADGGIRYVETISEAIRDENGQTVRTVGAIQDVSELLQAREALRGSQERLQLALQATGLGPWDWDLTTNAVEFWPEWKRQIGYEPDEIPNRYEEWESRLHPDDRDRVLTALRAYLDGRAAGIRAGVPAASQERHLPLDLHARRRAARRERPTDAHDRLPSRHHRAEAARRAVPAVAEDAGRRSARRRHRARFQQPARS